MRSAAGEAGEVTGSGRGGSWLLVSAAVVTAALLAGCGGGESDAVRKRMSALRDEVNLLENTVDRLEERLAVVEARPVEPGSAAAGAKAREPATVERPRLRVIRMEPGAEPDAAAGSGEAPVPAPPADDEDAPRPVIRGSGDRIETEFPPETSFHLDGGGEAGRARGPEVSHTPDRRSQPHSRRA